MGGFDLGLDLKLTLGLGSLKLGQVTFWGLRPAGVGKKPSM